jgi:chorismate-pyruvate lyase
MSSSSPSPCRRELFVDASASPADAAQAQRILRLLLAQDGSTTRLCESVAGGPVELHVLRQAVTHNVPPLVREHLPGERFIERITFLAAHGQVLMDNLTYIALHGLPADIERDLLAGSMPIGHLLARLWARRERVPEAAELHERLWHAVGMPDAGATRSYRILTPEGPRMLIAETYRRGMLMDP